MSYPEKINLKDYSFHDSQIIEVRETGNQTLEFLVYFLTDWEDNVSELHKLSFHDVIAYQINEIPFSGNPTILAINELDIVTHTWGQDENTITTKRNKIEMVTNADNRTIEYVHCQLRKA